MTTGSLAQPAASDPALRMERMYRIVVSVFLVSTFWDSGERLVGSFERVTGLVGLTAPMFAMIPLTMVGLLLWRIPRDRIAIACSGMILLWVSVQLIAGESLRGAVLVGSVLVFSLVVAGIRSNPALLWFQMRAAVVGPSLAAAAYYVGMYQVTYRGGWTLPPFNENSLAVYLGTGLIIGLGLACRRKKHAVFRCVALAIVFMPPLLVTGSRTGLMLTLFAVGGFFVVQIRARLALVAVAGGSLLLLAGTLVAAFVALAGTNIDERFSNEGWRSRYSVTRLASAQDMRFTLIWSGLQAGMRRPWIGHGLDAPRSFDWLSRNMVYMYIEDEGVGTINGYVDYLIMGGFPLVVLFLLLYLRVAWRLFRAARTSSGEARKLFALAVGLNLIFLLEIFTGETFGKFGWWLFGFGFQALGAEGMDPSEPPASKPRPAALPATG